MTAGVCPDLAEPPPLLACDRGCGFQSREPWRHQIHTLTGACRGYPLIPEADRR